MKKIKTGLLVMLLTLGICQLQAQVSDIRKPAFHSLNSIGLLNGSDNGALQVQTIEGMGYKNWFAGIGVGLDYYRYRSIPLFFDLRHYFGETKNKLFVYGDAGNTFPWITTKQKKNFAASDKFKGEGYFDIGAGYQMALGKRNALMFSLGYSRVNLKEIVKIYYFDSEFFSQAPYSPDQYNYKLDRLSIKVGLTL